MSITDFVRERAKGVADNVIASLLCLGGAALMGWLVQRYASLWGLNPNLAIAIGWGAGLLIAAALSLLLKPKSAGAPETETRAVTNEPRQNLSQSGVNIHNSPHFEFKPHIEVKTNAPDPESAKTQKKPARPKFTVTAPAVLPGLVKVDVNVIRRSKPNGETYFPIAVGFENIPEQDGFGEDDKIFAQISYREKSIPVLEMERVGFGCWIDEPLPSIKFPYRTPRFLLLGGWRLFGDESEKRDFRIFEYARELHRHVEMINHFATPRTLIVEVLLIPTSHPELSYEYKFEVPLFGACGYTIKQLLPS